MINHNYYSNLTYANDRLIRLNKFVLQLSDSFQTSYVICFFISLYSVADIFDESCCFEVCQTCPVHTSFLVAHRSKGG
jgi:hypothetical protein